MGFVKGKFLIDGIYKRGDFDQLVNEQPPIQRFRAEIEEGKVVAKENPATFKKKFTDSLGRLGQIF